VPLIRIGIGLLLAAVAGVAIFTVLDKDPAPAPWTLSQATVKPSAQRFAISIEAWCHAKSSDLDWIDVEESADSVTVTPYLDPAPGTNDACQTIIQETVELSDPLADRELLGQNALAG